MVGVIVPWNYPMIMAAWKLGPALAAGNSVVLKPSEKSPYTALRLGELALQAGVPRRWPPAPPSSAAMSACPSCWSRSFPSSCSPGCASASPPWRCCIGSSACPARRGCRRRTGNCSSGTPWWGYGLLLGAVACEASYVVIGKRLTAQVSPRRISALINLWGLALVTPFGVWQALSFDFGAVHSATWTLLCFYSIAASVVTVWLWMFGLHQVPAAQSGIFMIMVPVAAAAVGVGVLGEPFGGGHVLALAFAMAGLLLATWPARGTAGLGRRAASSTGV